MRIEHHWSKAERLESTRTANLDSLLDDYELVIWSCIQGGAQLANVILHARGITAEQEDQVHSDTPELNRQLPRDVAEILAVLKSIEELGPKFVRGIEPVKSELLRGCLDAYEKVKNFAARSLEAGQARR